MILIACQRQRKLSLNPLEPNYNATVEDLNRWGFEFTSGDDGICVYLKKIEGNTLMYFHLSSADHCLLTFAQGVSFSLDSLDYDVTEEEFNDQGYENWFKLNLSEFKRDSLKIVEILGKFNGAIVSSVERLGTSEHLTFRVGEWNSNETFDCIYTAFPQKMKSINISKTWDEK